MRSFKKSGGDFMKAITLWQPWAQLIVLGSKKIETRSWPTNHRGRTAIHAAKKPPDWIIHEPPFAFELKDYILDNSLPLGAVVGNAELVHCCRIEELFGSEYDTIEERAFGDWTPGRYGWIFDGPVLFSNPIPATGSQGFWEWRYGQ
jgi:hypothetical protein